MQTDQASKYTVQDLLRFLEGLEERGRMKPNTVRPWRHTVQRVFEGVGEDIAEADVRDYYSLEDLNNLDALEELLTRYQNKLNKEVSSATLQTYRARIARAIEEFLRYQQDPFNYKPGVQTRSTKKGAGRKSGSESKEQPKAEGTPPPEPPASRPNEGTKADPSKAPDVPFFLRKDRIIWVSNLPTDLTPQECERLSAFFHSMATQPGPQEGKQSDGQE